MENENLQKIDDILKRTTTDYSTAKKALEDANGDVLEAIILIENKNKNKSYSSNISNKGDQLLEQIKKLLSKGNATKLTIKKNNETILNLPVTAGIVGAFVAPFLSAAGITAALLTQCSVEITQSDGQVINLNQKVDQGMETVNSTMEDVKNSVENVKDNITKEAQNLNYSFSNKKDTSTDNNKDNEQTK